MIGSYVARRIGAGRTREWALTAERIDAATALAWGLVSTVVPAARLDEAVAAKLTLLRAGGPEALVAAKAFFRSTEGLTSGAAQEPAVRAISARVASAEARERIESFKRRSGRSPR
jgi:methylglutaconyl-CoA hydratase